ncbi:MAG: BACON domain-containing carbohydrate-binding protein, partial [Bacteroidales bacterium]|nr:BACON domain-containing carbohydrate-binding protein [Bacteroidales bacterium]
MKQILQTIRPFRGARKIFALFFALFLFVGNILAQTTVSYGWETSDDATQWTITEAIAQTSGEGNTGDYAGKINTNHTYVQFNEKVYVTSFSFAFKRTSNNSNYNVYIETSTDGETWTAVETYAMGSFLNGTYTTKTHDFDGTIQYYVRFHCYNTTAVRYVDDVTITYNAEAAVLEPSDLALSGNAELTFDLYDNADAQVVNYTTSSTGAVSVVENAYVTTVVDESNKTITVTPIAVTPTPQTITVNQASDDNYASGSVTFTVNIADNTPFSGGDVTFDATVDKDLSNVAAGEGSITKSGVTFTCDNGVLGNGSEYRLYKNSNTTFSTANGTITNIALTCTSGNPASGFGTLQGFTTDGENGTWTGNATSVTFVASGTQVRATQIVVTVDVNGVPDPVINADDVTLEYDATSGAVSYTIDNPAEDGVLAASTDVEWLSLGEVGETIPFTCTVNDASSSRMATVTLTYTYNTDQVIVNDFTITQTGNPNATMTIAEVRAQDTGSVVTTGTVTGCSGTTGYIQDATAAICVYGTSLSVGDNIRVSGTLSTFNGLLEITNPEVTVLSSDNTVEPTVMTIADINADYAAENAWQGLLVTIENATVTAISGQNTTVAQGENTIVVRNISSDVEYAVNDVLTLTGNIGCYNAAQIVNPTHVTVQQNVEPSITVAEAAVNAPYTGAEGTLTVTYENISEVVADVYFCDENGDAVAYDWIVAEINDDNNVDYVIDANEGEARTAYLKVYALGDNAEDVYSNLVTFTQDAYVAPVEPGDWVLTSLADLSENDVFVIVGTNADGSYAMTNDNGASSAPAAVGVTVVENKLAGEPDLNLQWTIGSDDAGYIFYPNGDNEKWLYCTNTNNGVRVGVNSNNVFSISEEDYLFNNATSRYIGVYNGQDWRCYTSINNNIIDQTFAFYKKSTPAVECEKIVLDESNGYTWSEDFEGYTTSTEMFTGVTPDCWTVAHQYFSASGNHIGDEIDTLPQVFYYPSFA